MGDGIGGVLTASGRATVLIGELMFSLGGASGVASHGC